MKKKLVILITILLALSMVGCGSNSVDPSQVITKDKDKSQEATTNEAKYYYSLNGEKIVVGQKFDETKCPAADSKYEIPSCAFQGTDNVYNFSDVEITTYKEKDEEIVYSIYFVEPSAKTEKGIALGDELSAMLNAYGEGYQQSASAYTFTEGSTKLTFIVENDVIVSIEYLLIVE